MSIVESASEERIARRAALEASLREVLFQIVKFVNEKKDHVPPITDATHFPYEITIPRSALFSDYLSLMERILLCFFSVFWFQLPAQCFSVLPARTFYVVDLI